MPNLTFNLFVKDKNFSQGMAKAQTKLKETSKTFSNINKDVNRSSDGMKKFGFALPLAKIAGTVYVLSKLAGAIKTATSSAMDQIETQNLFSVSMGDMAVETGKTIDKISELYGLDATNIRNTVGTFALLSRSMGMTTEQASKLSLSTYQLGTDLASLTNIPIEQVMGDLRSGLLGQSETVYKYGMDVTESALKTEALAQGITKSVRNMSQGEKMALRYAVMIKTGAIAQGDFAKTIEQPANQMRILRERLATLSRAIGGIFLNSLGKILPYLNAFFIILTRIANAIAKLTGYVKPIDENTSSTFGSTTENAEEAETAIGGVTKAIKELKATTLGFDELNVMNAPTTSSGGGGASIGTGDSILDGMEIEEYNSLLDQIPTKADEIANKIQTAFSNFWSKTGLGDFSFTALWEDHLKTPFNNFKLWTEESFLPPLMETLGMYFTGWWENAQLSFSVITTILGDVFAGIEEKLPEFIANFDETWSGLNEVIQEPLQFALDFINDVWLLIEEVWNNYGKDIVGSTLESFNKIWKYINQILNTFILPMVRIFVDFVRGLWEDHLKGLVKKIGEFVSELILTATAIYNNFIYPITSALMKVFSPVIQLVFKNLLGTVKDVFGGIIDQVGFLFDILSGLMQFLRGVFTGDWKLAWQGLKNVFIGVLNSLINALNLAITLAIKPLNILISVLNKVPGVSIPSLNVKIPTIPKLAMGGIVDSPTLSMIGEAGAEAVLPLNSSALEKYLAPVLGNNNISEDDMYNAVYRAMTAVESQSDKENVYNIYVDGVYSQTIKQMERKNIRSGRVIVPVGGR